MWTWSSTFGSAAKNGDGDDLHCDFHDWMVGYGIGGCGYGCVDGWAGVIVGVWSSMAGDRRRGVYFRRTRVV